MSAELFLEDLHRKPETLRALASRLRAADPWAFLTRRHARVVFLGMGSSAYAAGVVAARLRHRGIFAVAELASSDLLPRWGAGTLVVAISASGRSRETLSALDRLGREASVVALTNEPASPLAERCERTVFIHAGPEPGGVACRSYQHTLALLLALEARLTGWPLEAVAEVGSDRLKAPSIFSIEPTNGSRTSPPCSQGPTARTSSRRVAGCPPPCRALSCFVRGHDGSRSVARPPTGLTSTST